MNRSHYGILAGFAGAAMAAWWWRRRGPTSRTATSATERGEVIFRNTPIVGAEM